MGLGAVFALSLPGLAVLLVLLAAGELVLRRVRARRGGGPGGAVVTRAGVDQFATLFSGGKEVELRQQQVELMLRDEEDDGAPPRGPVDLGSGRVRLDGFRPER
ncbi:DUF6191 domain-containing protein [Actinosynnema sp.]|uniref:DUF6191 domain-containing protein n=1 Tax=Actinosynnema sp. TaxID=1872144 RepID=UPI003F86B3C8